MGNSLFFLGLAKKAGCLEIGEDSVSAALRSGRARLVLSAEDASDNSKRHAAESEHKNVPHIVLPFTKAELGSVLGRGTPGMLAVMDIGFAASFTAKLTVEYPDRYEMVKTVLDERAERAAQRKKEAKAHEKNLKLGRRKK